jgi:hypothetical protein
MSRRGYRDGVIRGYDEYADDAGSIDSDDYD